MGLAPGEMGLPPAEIGRNADAESIPPALASPTVDIQEVDPFDEQAVAAWHATYFASAIFERPHATPWVLEEMRADLRADNPGEKAVAYRGLVDGRVAVAATMHLPLKDNLKQAWIEINTLPALRNQGRGSLMLDHLTEAALGQGRSILTTEASYPYDGPPDGAGHPYVEFLLHRGFTFGLGDVQRVLDLPADESLLERLISEAEPHHRDYQIRHFRGPVPEDIIDTFGDLVGTLITEAPMGVMELEPEVMDRERIRADEALFEASGRTKYTSVAIAQDGAAAAYTDLVVPKHDPGRVHQWGTLARREHRGHRLGIALKARNLLWAQREQPGLRSLRTYNAEENTHMIGVNEAMGFRPVERLGEFQKTLG